MLGRHRRDAGGRRRCFRLGKIGYVESTRYCNFCCSFCALTAEGRPYQKYSLEYVRRQIEALAPRKYIFFVDNNFYGNDRNYFLARVALLRDMKREGYFEGWGCLVTNDFFLKDENLELVREAGCKGLFSGVESFDVGWLRKVNKLQNARAPQVETISKCLKAGIVFLYPLMLDTKTRTVDELRRELEFITGTPEITLPSRNQSALHDLAAPSGSTREGGEFRARSAEPAWLPAARFQSRVGFFPEISLRAHTGSNDGPAGKRRLLLRPGSYHTPAWLGQLCRPAQSRTHISTTEILDRV